MSYEDIPRSLRKGVLENMKIKRSDAFRSILDVLMYMEMSGTLKDEGLRGSFENVSRLDMKCVARDGIDQLRRNSQRLVSARNRLGVRWCSSVRILLTYIEKIKRLDEHTGTLQVITREDSSSFASELSKFIKARESSSSSSTSKYSIKDLENACKVLREIQNVSL